MRLIIGHLGEVSIQKRLYSGPITITLQCFQFFFPLFSLTVVDSDGASNSTTANLTVNKAVDYPPVANAGPNQVITLPQNSITLYGNQSTDDHSIVSYEWLLSPNSKGKVMEMQVSAGLQCSTWIAY